MKRRSRVEWQLLLSEYESSGTSQQQFCQERGISSSNFSNWKSKLKREPFVEIPLAGLSNESSESQVTVELPSGAVLRFSW